MNKNTYIWQAADESLMFMLNISFNLEMDLDDSINLEMDLPSVYCS